MRAKGNIRITETLLKSLLGIPNNVALDKVYIEDNRGIVNLVISTDAPAYLPALIPGAIVPITFDVAEGQEVPSVNLDEIRRINGGKH